MKTHYLSCAETATMIRAALKKSFPGVKFSVRSKTYSMGASINVDWTDGPTNAMVDAVVKPFEFANFDGSIDMQINKSHWLMPDGKITVASCPGTTGSAGYIPPVREWMPHPDAKLIHFGAHYVFTCRKISPAFGQRALAALKRRYAHDFDDVRVTVSDYNGCADFHIPPLARWPNRDMELKRFVSRFMSV